jgi:hypothetical protein
VETQLSRGLIDPTPCTLLLISYSRGVSLEADPRIRHARPDAPPPDPGPVPSGHGPEAGPADRSALRRPCVGPAPAPRRPLSGITQLRNANSLGGSTRPTKDPPKPHQNPTWLKFANYSRLITTFSHEFSADRPNPSQSRIRNCFCCSNGQPTSTSLRRPFAVP